MNVLLIILLSLTYWSFTPVAQAASPGAGLMQAQKEAEAKGFRFDGKREEIVAKAQKEGALRALLGFDKPTIVALRDGFRKKYPFINPQFEEHGNPAESQRYLLELQTGRTSDWDIVNVLNEGQQDYAPYTEKIDLRAMAEQGVLQIPPKMINPESRNVIALSSTIDASAYHKKLLPPDLVPKSWEDFLKPEHSGRKLLVDVRPNSIAGLIPAMGLGMGGVLRAQARRTAADLGARPHALSEFHVGGRIPVVFRHLLPRRHAHEKTRRAGSRSFAYRAGAGALDRDPHDCQRHAPAKRRHAFSRIRRQPGRTKNYVGRRAVQIFDLFSGVEN